MSQAFEVNFDGIIGPTHNYSGLSKGNLASESHADKVSHPKAAALQGLSKMRTLMQLGYRQGFFPPQIRPELGVIRQLGFEGDDQQLLQAAAQQAPELLAMSYSASSMWAANAATVTPSSDAPDNKVHFTPANLVTTMHRAIECHQTAHALQTIFSDPSCFQIHNPVPGHTRFGDEGAANHNRLCDQYGHQGIGLYVHGDGLIGPSRFPARQTLEASQGVARQHGVMEHSVFLQQNPEAIDAGAFHNDVVCVANGPVLFYHEQAFDAATVQEALLKMNQHVEIQPICVKASEISLDNAIQSYLFNSQLLASPEGDMAEMTLVAPLECQENEAVRNYLQNLSRDQTQPIRDVVFVDVRQSMSNGGGPACLRLRVVLNEQEFDAIDSRFIVSDARLDDLELWVERFYRQSLHPEDLQDPAFMDESLRTLKALEVVLGIEGFYNF